MSDAISQMLYGAAGGLAVVSFINLITWLRLRRRRLGR